MSRHQPTCLITNVGYADDVMVAPEDWRLDFTLPSARVRTATEGGQYFVHIEREADVDDEMDSALEVARYTRPLTLVLQGVLSFFSGIPITVYGVHSTKREKTPKRSLADEMSISRFEMGGRDFRDDAKKLLVRLQSQGDDANLLASVLDRWRRASYLTEAAETEEQDGPNIEIKGEEIFLHYFHVVELLADDAHNKGEGAIKAKVHDFISAFYSGELMMAGKALSQKVAERFSVVYAVLSEDVSLTTKILRLLSNADAATPRVRALVGDLVKVRNAIAHGRAVFRPKVTWPLPAFFPVHEGAETLLPLLRIFAARLIARHCDASAWAAEWDEIKASLSATPEDIRRLVAGGELEKMTARSLISGNPHWVTVAGLVEQYYDGQIDFRLFEQIVGRCLLNVRLSENIADQMLVAAAILADSQNEQLSKRAKYIVKRVIAMRWESSSDAKDLFRYAEIKGRTLTWYRAWLTRKGRRSVRKPDRPE